MGKKLIVLIWVIWDCKKVNKFVGETSFIDATSYFYTEAFINSCFLTWICPAHWRLQMSRICHTSTKLIRGLGWWVLNLTITYKHSEEIYKTNNHFSVFHTQINNHLRSQHNSSKMVVPNQSHYIAHKKKHQTNTNIWLLHKRIKCHVHTLHTNKLYTHGIICLLSLWLLWCFWRPSLLQLFLCSYKFLFRWLLHIVTAILRY